MAKMKIHELAKEITELNGDELKSKDIIGFLNEKGKDYKSPMSNVEDEECELVRKHFTKKKEAKEAPAPKAEPVKTPAPKAAAPAEQDRQRRPVDAQGRPVPPMGPDGKPMRRPVDAQGRPIPLGPDGKPMRRPVPLGPDGKPMRRPVDAQGRPIPLGPDGKPMRRPVPLGPDGKPMRRPVDAQGRPIPLGPDGRPMRRPVDAQGRPIPLGPDGRPVRRPADGQVRPDAAPKAENTDAQNKPAEAPAAEVKAPETPVAEVKAPEIKSVNVLDADGKPLNVFSNPARPVNVYDNQNRNQNRDGQRGNGVSRGGNDYQRRNGDSQGSDRGYRDGQRGGYGRDGQNRGEGGRDFQNRGDRRPFDGNRDGRSGDQRGGFNKDRGGFDNRRPGGQGGSFGDKKPFGQRGGAFGGKDFDKDAPQPNRFQKKSDQRGPKDNLKSELANEIEKNKRGNAFNDKLANKVKDKNRDSRNFEDRDPKNSKKKDPNRKGAFQKPVVAPKKEEDPSEIKTIYIPDPVTIKELADKLKQSTGTIIKKLFLTGKIVTINSELSFEEAEELALEYNCIADHEVKVNVVEELLKEDEEDEALMIKRPPVVCVMGHVDHGKTSLLDRIRETNVTEKEAGGITQHIGAYVVEIDGQKITFLDTPGHEAFTSMRMRGAKSTDIAILVVAADDGVMPQTVEAINHAKAANVQIIVAVNKIDKPGANVERVKQELTEYGLTAEEWGGETVFCPVSAKTGEGIENLLEMILLTADVCELKANPNRKARGIVIEAELDKGKGPVATILVQKGTLNVGDNIAIGSAHGKVRAMMDHNGKSVKKATPSTPVEILGLNGVPNAGEVVMVVKDEKEARNIAEAFIAQSKEKLLAETKARLSLDGLFSQIQAGNIKELNIIIKADVQGSVEAVKQSLEKLSNEEVVVRVIHGGVGAVNESDVNLASASNAIIIGFNVKPDNTAKDTAERENVEIKYYRVIYNAIEDVENAMKGMLKPIFQEKVIGHAEVRQTFKASGLGVIAGSYVLDGKITRGCSARITRAGEQIFEGALASLKRFKDDVKEVDKGFECGLVFEKFNDLQEFDLVEFYVMEEIPR